MLVHLIGDIVQPLHSISRYHPEDLNGDAGANGFALKYRYRVKNLHSLWDKVLYEERNNIRRPIDNDDWAEMQITVDNIMDDHANAVSDPASYQSVDMMDWINDSFDVAKTLYEGVTAGDD